MDRLVEIVNGVSIFLRFTKNLCSTFVFIASTWKYLQFDWQKTVTFAILHSEYCTWNWNGRCLFWRYITFEWTCVLNLLCIALNEFRTVKVLNASYRTPSPGNIFARRFNRQNFMQQWATTLYFRDKIDLIHYCQGQALISQDFAGCLEMIWMILYLYFIHNMQIKKKNCHY